MLLTPMVRPFVSSGQAPRLLKEYDNADKKKCCTHAQHFSLFIKHEAL